ncbi:chemotaxis protein CheX [Anaerobacterium chartisolvens]|uniref:Chemotaxis protein CheX n=1 Tax=Anaerobacterium chartisolvens TaxID=1297424 RepID=A0A369B545_9FIRM|nr:chemotaxis protein CheX [Anaerobacterium chartisolvens]RCX14804.1 chemotaxis protein CheX [Anaerobacterium chartisolvens]
MDVKYVNPFLESFTNTLGQFGVSDIKRAGIKKKANMYVDLEISAVVGLNGGIQGYVALSMSQDTAKKLVSSMMMGMAVAAIDDVAKSALGELSSMIAGAASTMSVALGASFRTIPPTVLTGAFNICPLEALVIDFETGLGKIEFNIGFTM